MAHAGSSDLPPPPRCQHRSNATNWRQGESLTLIIGSAIQHPEDFKDVGVTVVPMEFVPSAIKTQDQLPGDMRLALGATTSRGNVITHRGALAGRPACGEKVVLGDIKMRGSLARGSTGFTRIEEVIIVRDLRLASYMIRMALVLPSFAAVNCVRPWYCHST